ncbi:MAG: DUF4230 domain-containing protein [Treponema sp.]|nr:DUF4230 domain-containing protein [Treponema sp.]
MKRFLLPAILIFVIAGLLVFIGLLLGGGKFGFNQPFITEKSDISAHSVIKEVLPIGEYASLAYQYTTVVKDINAKDIKGWTIPFTTRKYIFTYDGTMKMGIDGTKIQIEEMEQAENAVSTSGLRIIKIILPPVKILSHEINENSIEVFEQSQTIFNEIKIADAFGVTAERKHDLEEKIMSGPVVKEARASTEHQFGALLKGLPGIRGVYELEFVWYTPDPAGSVNPDGSDNPGSPPENQAR